MDLIKANLDYAIFGVLGLMSFLMIAYFIERIFFYGRIKLDSFTNEHALYVALTAHLTIIASIASNAPYVGLLGTVVGILIAFFDMAQSGDLSVSTVMLGLAIALKATALGLLVAIPATMFYNALLRKADVLTANWKALQAD
ncbi:TonB-system energizer ExbB [Solemya elarraichensis gill symbiont]|uniref:TonB-system energizer ExbB n=1 Tax=Solemya elarraichensis gill symbiont TaxID=1918949 RepID=A0A1T2KZK2_9GAMM|nr:TonB-system energizer ExbB [Solemya elarraichensis gill symbiont]OOZ38251.1 TonB-system energizer ExbB [Solemya elarraichensis gill symbiont]